ncbi:unnamed protein product, partial [Mesorhabditis spiculigera]
MVMTVDKRPSTSHESKANFWGSLRSRSSFGTKLPFLHSKRTSLASENENERKQMIFGTIRGMKRYKRHSELADSYFGGDQQVLISAHPIHSSVNLMAVRPQIAKRGQLSSDLFNGPLEDTVYGAYQVGNLI